MQAADRVLLMSEQPDGSGVGSAFGEGNSGSNLSDLDVR
jgi:hypothetical protein